MMSWSFVGQIAVLTILALLVLLVLVGFVVAFRQGAPQPSLKVDDYPWRCRAYTLHSSSLNDRCVHEKGHSGLHKSVHGYRWSTGANAALVIPQNSKETDR